MLGGNVFRDALVVFGDFFFLSPFEARSFGFTIWVFQVFRGPWRGGVEEELSQCHAFQSCHLGAYTKIGGALKNPPWLV